MTEKLFYKDSHLVEFDAEVLSCQEDGEYYEVVLSQTTFFPEGGGQYADTGVIGDVRVLDVQEDKEGVIFHKIEKPLTKGEMVHGQIDWEERFDKMQQHTAEHIVSGLVHERFGYNNVGFHLASDYCTMDFDGPITKEELKEIEEASNRAVYENLDVKILYPTKEELADMDYRSKIEIEGQVRIVNVPGYDVCACCAPHVKKTGEIGNIKMVDMVKYKGGVRITVLCGLRALKDHVIKDDNAKTISALLCAKELEIADAVEHLKEEKDALKAEIASLQQKLLGYRAKEIDVTGNVTAVFDEELFGNMPRELMNLLLDEGANVAAIFAGNEEDGFRYVIGSRNVDVRPIGKKLNEKFEGRGGGKDIMVQGSLTGKVDAIKEALNEY